MFDQNLEHFRLMTTVYSKIYKKKSFIGNSQFDMELPF